MVWQVISLPSFFLLNLLLLPDKKLWDVAGLHLISFSPFCLSTAQVTAWNKLHSFYFACLLSGKNPNFYLLGDFMSHWCFKAIVPGNLFVCTSLHHQLSACFRRLSARLQWVKSLPKCVRLSVSQDFTPLILMIQEISKHLWLSRQKVRKRKSDCLLNTFSFSIDSVAKEGSQTR